MASIEFRKGKKWNSYLITVFLGENESGKKIRVRETWNVPEGMTPAKAKKAAQEYADKLEQELKRGSALSGETTFAEYAYRYFEQKKLDASLAPKTYDNYYKRMPRITAAIGNIPLNEITDIHLLNFYNQLRANGIKKNKRFVASEYLLEKVKTEKITQQAIADGAQIGIRTVHNMMSSENITLKTVEAIARFFEEDKNRLFVQTSSDDRLPESTIKGYHHTVSSILSAAVAEHLIQVNPAKSEAIKFRVEEHEQPIIENQQKIQLLMNSLTGKSLIQQIAVRLPLATGLRLGEIMALTWHDINFDSLFVDVNKSVKNISSDSQGNGGQIVGAPKTKKSKRIVSIDSGTASLLQAFKNSTQFSADEDFLFTNPTTGKLFLNTTVSKWVKKILSENGMSDLHYYSLRHTHASLLIGANVDVASVSAQLGHANTATTTRVYTHAIMENQAKLAGVVASAIFGEDKDDK